MFNFLFLPGFLLYGAITFGSSFFLKPENSVSLSVITNSAIVSTGSYLLLQNYISPCTMNNIFQFTVGFLCNDFLFKFTHQINKDKKLKIIHHIISLIAIYLFPYTGNLIPTLFFTEITNIPLETRNILKNIGYNIFYLQEMMIALLYVTFFFYRIYSSPFQIYMSYQNKIISKFEVYLFMCMYSLWSFWFYKLNYLIIREIKKKYILPKFLKSN